jgi:hypothetical protein
MLQVQAKAPKKVAKMAAGRIGPGTRIIGASAARCKSTCDDGGFGGLRADSLL